MTGLDVIKMIGDRLTEIDVKVGSLRPNDPETVRLQDLRRLLDSRQLTLSRQLFDDNTAAFQAAAKQLSDVNARIKGRIDQIEDLQRTIRTVTRLLDAVTSFMTTIHAFG